MKNFIKFTFFLFLFFENIANAKNILTPIELHSFKNSFYNEIKSENKLILLMAIPIGYSHDPASYPDLAHLMEHLFINMNGDFSKDTILKNSSVTAITQPRSTQYVMTIEPEDINKTFKYFNKFFNHPDFKEKDIIAQLHEIEEEENPKDVEELEIIKYLQGLGNPKHDFTTTDFLPVKKLKKKSIPSIQYELMSLHEKAYRQNTSLIVYASKENLRKLQSADEKYAKQYKFVESPIENQIDLTKAFINRSSTTNEFKTFANQTKDNISFISPVNLKKSIANDLDVNIFEYLIKLKGTGSLYKELYQNGLISNIDFEKFNIDLRQDLFITTFKLTKKGKININEIKEKYSAYLKYIAEFDLGADALKTLSEIKESHLLMPSPDVVSNSLVQNLERNGVLNYKNIETELTSADLSNIYLEFKNEVLPLLIHNQIICFSFTDNVMPAQELKNKIVNNFDLTRINKIKYASYPGYDVVRPKEKPISIFQNKFSQVYFKYATSSVKTAKVTVNLHFKTGSKSHIINNWLYHLAIQQKLADWQDISKIDDSLLKIEENFDLQGKPVTSIIFYAKEEDLIKKINQLSEVINIFPLNYGNFQNEKGLLKAILKEEKSTILEEGGLEFVIQALSPYSRGRLTYEDIEAFDFTALSKIQKEDILMNVSMLINGNISNPTIEELKTAEASNQLFSEISQDKKIELKNTNQKPATKNNLGSFGKKPDITIIEYKLKATENPMLPKLLQLGTLLNNHEHFKQKIDNPYYKYDFVEFNKNLYYNFYYSDKNPDMTLSDLKKHISENYKKNEFFKFYIVKYFIKNKISSSAWSFRDYNRYYQMELINQSQMFNRQATLEKSWNDFSYWDYKKTYKNYLLNPERINIYTNNEECQTN